MSRPLIFDSSGRRRIQRVAGFAPAWWDPGRTPGPVIGETVEAIGFELPEESDDEESKEELE